MEPSTSSLIDSIEAKLGPLPPEVRSAFLSVDRARFVRACDRAFAYENWPLPLDTPHGDSVPPVAELLARHGAWEKALFAGEFRAAGATISAPLMYALAFPRLVHPVARAPRRVEAAMATRATRLCWMLALGFSGLVACRGERDALGIADAGGAEAGASVRDTLRDESRLILERHCGRCHIREYPTAVPGALAVFDLREPEWSRRMRDAQLRSAQWRLGEPLPPDGVPNEVSDEERSQFKRFVEVELAERARLDGGKP